MYKSILLILALASCFTFGLARTKPLNFENPGNRRLLKTDAGNYYYFRAKPEKSMTLNVSGITSLELRSFAIEGLRKPQVISILGKKSTTHDLVLKERLGGFYIYEPLQISLPKGTQTIEILCYSRSIYFRPFHTFSPKPVKPAKPANLLVKAHGGIINVSHNGTKNDYYVFNPSQSLKFDLNNSRTAVIYVRSRLLDRDPPIFEVWRDGEMIQTHEFSLKRTSVYQATGIVHLSTGLKIELPPTDGKAQYELRANSDHLFLARPVLLKAK